jgi:prepilin-type N-terminal cleavage/methylation domain-containing protein
MVSKRYSHRLLKHDCAARPHAGFTLVELMIVISLILLLAVMTASAINTSISGDKVRGGARQVQSFLGGARDRAIYSKAPRGVLQHGLYRAHGRLDPRDHSNGVERWDRKSSTWIRQRHLWSRDPDRLVKPLQSGTVEEWDSN